jgi:hypothetical protein
MNLKPIHAFLGGVVLTALIAAAKFVGGTPLDQTFTYQGQLRNAGQLVNGPVDLKISMWDADTGGSQVGSTNTFNAMQLNDGRFACGLNFGNAAFDGSNRWIQVEFRNPAGSGQYQALSPRDKITATPYALYALNGANGVWVYDTNQQSVSVMGKKVGIGTSNPTAALEVVDATGGDDSVKLPAGSIGAVELTTALSYVMEPVEASDSASFTIQVPRAGVLEIDISDVLIGWQQSNSLVILLNGAPVPYRAAAARDTNTGYTSTYLNCKAVASVGAGPNHLQISGLGQYGQSMISCRLNAGILPR